MKKQILNECPICSNELSVTELHCKKCDTTIKGDFKLNKFSKLSEENLYFIEIFIKTRGNIKEIGKELGVSYPTIRNRLDDIIKQLGYEPKSPKIDKQKILSQLEQGEITTEQAVKLLKGNKY